MNVVWLLSKLVIYRYGVWEYDHLFWTVLVVCDVRRIALCTQIRLNWCGHCGPGRADTSTHVSQLFKFDSFAYISVAESIGVSVLNLKSVLHPITLSWALLVPLLRAILLQSVVVLVFLYVNPSLSCLLLCPSFLHLNIPQSLSSCLSLKSLSSISIVHPYHLPFLNLFLFS